MSGPSARPSGSRRALRWPRLRIARTTFAPNAQRARDARWIHERRPPRSTRALRRVAHRRCASSRRDQRPSPWTSSSARRAGAGRNRTRVRAHRPMRRSVKRPRGSSTIAAPPRAECRPGSRDAVARGPRRVVRDALKLTSDSPPPLRARTRETPRGAATPPPRPDARHSSRARRRPSRTRGACVRPAARTVLRGGVDCPLFFAKSADKSWTTPFRFSVRRRAALSDRPARGAASSSRASLTRPRRRAPVVVSNGLSAKRARVEHGRRRGTTMPPAREDIEPRRPPPPTPLPSSTPRVTSSYTTSRRSTTSARSRGARRLSAHARWC